MHASAACLGPVTLAAVPCRALACGGCVSGKAGRRFSPLPGGTREPASAVLGRLPQAPAAVAPRCIRPAQLGPGPLMTPGAHCADSGPAQQVATDPARTARARSWRPRWRRWRRRRSWRPRRRRACPRTRCASWRRSPRTTRCCSWRSAPPRRRARAPLGLPLLPARRALAPSVQLRQGGPARPGMCSPCWWPPRHLPCHHAAGHGTASAFVNRRHALPECLLLTLLAGRMSLVETGAFLRAADMGVCQLTTGETAGCRAGGGRGPGAPGARRRAEGPGRGGQGDGGPQRVGRLAGALRRAAAHGGRGRRGRRGARRGHARRQPALRAAQLVRPAAFKRVGVQESRLGWSGARACRPCAQLA